MALSGCEGKKNSAITSVEMTSSYDYYCYGIDFPLFLQYLELRFGKWIRKLTTIMFIVMNLFFLPVIMYIPSLAFAEGKILFRCFFGPFENS